MEYSWRDIHVSFTKEEAENLLENLDQCSCEGYIQSGDPAYSAYEKLIKAIEKDL